MQKKKKIAKKYETELKETLADIMMSDPLQKCVREAAAAFIDTFIINIDNVAEYSTEEKEKYKQKMLPDFNYETCISDSYDIKRNEAITKSYNIRHDKNADLQEIYIEIATRLQACDTYEQELAVMKAYRIIKEDGTVNYDEGLVAKAEERGKTQISYGMECPVTKH